MSYRPHCPYPEHAVRDWQRVDPKTGELGPVVCGVCHPPKVPIDHVRWVNEHAESAGNR